MTKPLVAAVLRNRWWQRLQNCLSGGLSSQQNVDLLLDPVLVVGSVGVGALLVDKTRQVCQLVDEIKQLKIKTRPVKTSFRDCSWGFGLAEIEKFCWNLE